MKTLLWLEHGGLGERDKPGAPTFWKTVEGFLSAGWRILVVNIGTNTDTPLGERDYGDGLNIIRFNPPFLRQKNWKKIGAIFRLMQGVWIDRKLSREAERLIRKHGLNRENTVVYGMETSAVRAAKAVSKRHNMKLVTRFYGIWDMYPTPDNLYYRIARYPNFSAYSTPADLVIMTNDGTNGDKMLQRMHNPSRSVFWRNGVDLSPEGGEVSPFFERFPKDAVILMTLCRLSPLKCVDKAIDAFAAVEKTYPDLRLVMCGYGGERELLEKKVQEYGLEDKAVFTGQIPHTEIYSYLKRADIFLSLFNASNLGNPLMEAMRCSLPIITRDVGDTATVIENDVNGILLPAEQTDQLLPGAICRLLDDPAERKRLGDAAGAYARENFWTWDERVAAEVKLVGELLAE